MNARTPSPPESGFSLVELLVVIGVIVLMATLVASGIQGRDGPKLRAAEDALISQVQAARNTAVARNVPCRLLVDAGNDPENGRRRLALAVKPLTGNSTVWEVAGPPAKLPDGTALLVDDGQIPASTQGGSSSPPQTMRGSDLVAPASLKAGDWFYFEFDPSGTCEDNAGAILVVGVVWHDRNGWVRKSSELIRGIMLRRAGQSSAFADPEHIREAYNAL
jgi:prepilin-type N-terminal cleavage/methylation domain-containing protein